MTSPTRTCTGVPPAVVVLADPPVLWLLKLALLVPPVVATLMASPLFELVYGRKARAGGSLGALGAEEGDPHRDPAIGAAPR